jgi:predicted DCC family thiol-disulfide oxidoreductase YuxK
MLPWQKADLEGVGVTREEATDAAWWVDPRGRRLRGHRAIGAVLLACGGIWSMLGRLLLLPPPFAWVSGAVYALVARYRRHLPGITPACRRRYEWDAGRDAACRE